ncbi:MAG: tRNA (guanosine(46)-N7)-methyltransferase TrmB [Leptolyngbya foveolarum]|uniref:tRNA (guanine-N(7)-)-methyltransferase n=1 Tax=Leptolyngbya foveolarum TaxID=47253 RepID=A0A2W4WFQ3_9CYAN|nr:MAG: tRNA (guanosine(46)-N7)-methyltransferase TrmB [Leptolyngbya foveolarum]
MAKIRRVRQHVNPLSSKYAESAIAPNWSDVFADVQRPLHLDIGCAKGDFVREMAQLVPDWNFLGIEIREPLVERALMKRDRDEQHNLHFVFCNANNSLETLLSSWPGGCPLQRVSIQFPDPWFKKRHQKRRVVQPELVEQLAKLMPVGAWVWLQSDIEEVCEEMCDRFDENSDFMRAGNGWLAESPFPVLTDRERVTAVEKGLPVYRAKYIRQ